MSFFFPADPATQLAGNAQRHHVKLEFGNIIFKQFNNCVILARRLNTSAADGTHTAAYSPHAHDIVRKDIPQVQLQGVRSRCCSAARAPQRSASTGGRHPPHRRITRHSIDACLPRHKSYSDSAPAALRAAANGGVAPTGPRPTLQKRTAARRDVSRQLYRPGGAGCCAERRGRRCRRRRCRRCRRGCRRQLGCGSGGGVGGPRRLWRRPAGGGLGAEEEEEGVRSFIFAGSLRAKGDRRS